MTRESAVVDPSLAPDPPPRGEDGPGLPDASRDDCDVLWSMCLAIAQRRRQGLQPDPPRPGRKSGNGRRVAPRVARRAAGGWELEGDWSAAARSMFDLYRPLLDVAPGERYLLGHLGQSIDGRIATRSGDSCFINGQQNLVHMHRLRALCDAVLVGAGTVVADDPQLTTRLVPGPHAARVVIDPSIRLTPAYRICSDGICPTLIARLPSGEDSHSRHDPAAAGPAGSAGPAADAGCGRAEIIPATSGESGIDLPGLLETLGGRGLHVILVEGGGITVSRFLAQRLLDRLQIAIAPVIIGSGRQGLQLPEVLALSDCLRPSCRHHRMGQDILWDLDLRAGPGPALASAAG